MRESVVKLVEVVKQTADRGFLDKKKKPILTRALRNSERA